MTRRRFIKLLMAHGYQHRAAVALAWEAWRNYESYAEAWQLHYERLAKYKMLTAMITQAAKRASMAFHSFAEMLRECFGGYVG